MQKSLQWINPYDQAFAKELLQVRSNFHTHAGQIDKCAVNTLQDTESLYTKLGYGLLAISNHNRFTPMQHQNSPDQALQYLDAYEHTVAQHILCLGIDRIFDLDTPYQQIIDETGKLGGFTILCHPNWIREDFWPDSMLMDLQGYCGIEVINGVVSARHPGSGLATKEWDRLLSARKLVWGFGTDDYHLQSDAGRAWTMILSSANTPATCVDAVKCGRHYASTGLRLTNLQISNGNLHCTATRMLPTHLPDYRYRFIGLNGTLLMETEAPDAQCPLPEGEGYVRVQVINEEGAMLWTQPVYTAGWFT